jgi:hypothetical protein
MSLKGYMLWVKVNLIQRAEPRRDERIVRIQAAG